MEVELIHRIYSGIKRRLRNGTRRALRSISSQRQRRRQAFREVYKDNVWGTDPQTKFFSGAGSRGIPMERYVEQMATLIRRHSLELGRPLTIVDLGCGDFQVGRALLSQLPDITYIGCDIVPELIAHNSRTYADQRTSFRQIDIVTDSLPAGDICLIRQVLQHLSNSDIDAFLKRAEYPYLYVTEGRPVQPTGSPNPDKPTGHDVRFDWQTGKGRGVELNLPPFGLITSEVFRAINPPAEVIITERVILKSAKKL